MQNLGIGYVLDHNIPYLVPLPNGGKFGKNTPLKIDHKNIPGINTIRSIHFQYKIANEVLGGISILTLLASTNHQADSI